MVELAYVEINNIDVVINMSQHEIFELLVEVPSPTISAQKSIPNHYISHLGPVNVVP